MSYAFSYENFSKLQVLRCENGKMTLLRELFHHSTAQGYMLANATYPTYVEGMFWNNFSITCIFKDVMLMFTLFLTST